MGLNVDPELSKKNSQRYVKNAMNKETLVIILAVGAVGTLVYFGAQKPKVDDGTTYGPYSSRRLAFGMYNKKSA